MAVFWQQSGHAQQVGLCTLGFLGSNNAPSHFSGWGCSWGAHAYCPSPTSDCFCSQLGPAFEPQQAPHLHFYALGLALGILELQPRDALCAGRIGPL